MQNDNTTTATNDKKTDNKSIINDNNQSLEHKYPAKRGVWGVIAKNVFLLLTAITTDMKVIGRENFPIDNPYVVASNHQCFADGVLIVKYLPRGHFKYMCCLAASDLETNYGWLGRLIMRVGRGIAVDRFGNPVRGLIKAKKEVEQGNICFVFPEGTRTSDGLLGEFKDGAAYLAVKSKKPLVPVYISGAYEVWPRSSKYPHPYKGFLKRKKIRIFVGKPLLGEDYGNDAHTLTEALSKWMNEMQDKYRNPDEAAKLTNT